MQRGEGGKRETLKGRLANEEYVLCADICVGSISGQAGGGLHQSLGGGVKHQISASKSSAAGALYAHLGVISGA